MIYEVTHIEYGRKKFYKIERMRDFVWGFFPYNLNKVRVLRVKKNGIREVGMFVNDKRVVIFPR